MQYPVSIALQIVWIASKKNVAMKAQELIAWSNYHKSIKREQFTAPYELEHND